MSRTSVDLYEPCCKARLGECNFCYYGHKGVPKDCVDPGYKKLVDKNYFPMSYKKTERQRLMNSTMGSLRSELDAVVAKYRPKLDCLEIYLVLTSRATYWRGLYIYGGKESDYIMVTDESDNVDNLSTDLWGGAGPDCRTQPVKAGIL